MSEAELESAVGEPLIPGGTAALKPVDLPPFKPDEGPYHKIQYIIELVGRQLVPADSARAFLEPKNRKALGEPDIYVMAPGQKRWRRLWSGDDAITYDSLAFAWDLVTGRGLLNKKAAKELWKRTEDIGKSLSRRAVPLPPPEEAAQAAENLKEIIESLDIGVDASVRSNAALDTKRVVKAAYALGFRLGKSGLLEWRLSGWPEALLALYPLGSATEFNPNKQPSLEGVGIGYSVPCSPAPQQVLERFFSSIDYLCETLGAEAFDDEERNLTAERREELRSNLRVALDTYKRIGLEPGSPEALILFES